MKRIMISIVLIASVFTASAQFFRGPKIDTVRIWPNGAPNAFELKPEQLPRHGGDAFTEALMEVYPARNPNGLCVIMTPGGAYMTVAVDPEGREFKDWFNAHGITCCVLKYRLPYGHHDVPLSDVHEAIRIMKGRAQELGITKIGIMGGSAGGHLASTAATHYDAETRPDFQVLLYPVITMDESFTHQGSRDNLLGTNPSQELIDLYSNEKQVTKDNPPAFIVVCEDDGIVPPVNSLRYYEALINNKVPAEMHVYAEGNHGWGWRDTFIHKHEAFDALLLWLNQFMK